MTNDDDRLSQTFAALANATRRAILERLAEGDATVNELAEPFNLTLSAVSKHIKVLEQAGLITQGQKRQYRPCAVDITALEAVSRWTEHYQRIWLARFDRMYDYIKQTNILAGYAANNKEFSMTDDTGILSKEVVMIERTFDAPVGLIWQMWTQPEHFKNWYGPNGFTVPVAEMDVRVGGKHLFCMATPDGSMKMWTTGEYTEVIPNTRLAYTEIPADEHGNMRSDEQVSATLVTVLLEDLNGRTRMVMTHAGLPSTQGADEGWKQSFTKLADYIELVNRSK